MIFEINKELVNSEDEHFIKCLEYLFLGFIEGNHLIYMKPETLSLVYEKYHDKIDSRLKNNLVSFEETFMYESKILMKYVNCFVRIIPQIQEEKILKEDDIEVRLLKTSRFLNSSKIQKSTILGENEEDCLVYEIMAKEYIQYSKLSNNIVVKLKTENGGGNTIAPVLNRKITSDDEMCLCLLDSDKKYPSDTSLGQTSLRVLREVKPNLNPKYEFHIVQQCRELENIIPEGFYYKKYHSDQNKKEIFSKLDKLENINSELKYFLDMKEGLRHFNIKTESDWNLVSELIDLSKVSCNTINCSSKKNCNYKVIESFGTNILKDFIDFYYNISAFDFSIILESMDTKIREIWNYIGKLVFSWTCATLQNYKNT